MPDHLTDQQIADTLLRWAKNEQDENDVPTLVREILSLRKDLANANYQISGLLDEMHKEREAKCSKG